MNKNVRRGLAAAGCALLVALLTCAALASWTWCRPGDFVSCLGRNVLVLGVIWGPQLLLALLGIGTILWFWQRDRHQ